MTAAQTSRKVILMGIFAAIFGCGKGDGRYVSEKAFENTRTNQAAMAPQTLEQLHGLGVTEETELKLEFFFYTNTEDKASALAGVLQQRDYSVESGVSAHDKKVSIVTGWTTPMVMNESTVVGWVREMCQVGFDHDCEFDGWGTTPEQ